MIVPALANTGKIYSGTGGCVGYNSIAVFGEPSTVIYAFSYV